MSDEGSHLLHIINYFFTT